VSVQRYAHPSPTEDSQLLSQLEKLLLPTFIVISLAFPLTTQVGDIVGERETKVLQAMTSMGLLHSAYWVSWHVFHALINLTYAFLFTVVGIIFKYQVFFETNFLVMWLTIFWYSLAIQGISYFSAALITKQKYSTTIGGIFMFFSLVSTVLVQLGIPYDVPFETFTPTWIKSVSFAMNPPLPFKSPPPFLSPQSLSFSFSLRLLSLYHKFRTETALTHDLRVIC
jgi:hypothetical protein